MTWQTAQSAAAETLRRLSLPADLRGATVHLADYESEEDLKFMKGHAEWPLTYHRMVNTALARLLRKRGAAVDMVKISMAAYFAWLSQFDLPNTTANRAQFIVWSTAPEPKPRPEKA